MNDLAEVFAAYRANYLEIYPSPAPPPQENFDNTRIGVALLFILCLTIYAATRTAAVIEVTEQASGYSETLARFLSWVAVVGIEGMVLFMSITHTRAAERLYRQEHAWILIILGGLISALAGVSSGLGLFDDTTVLNWIGGVNIGLTLVLGIGATVMVWASGEFVGTAIHNHRVAQRLSQKRYAQERDTYETTLRERWDASPEKAAATHDLELTRARQEAELAILQKQAAHDERYANYQRDRGVDVLGLNGNGNGHGHAAPTNGSKTDLAIQWLQAHPARHTWRTLDDVPSAREIKNALETLYPGEVFSTGSTGRAREKILAP